MEKTIVWEPEVWRLKRRFDNKGMDYSIDELIAYNMDIRAQKMGLGLPVVESGSPEKTLFQKLSLKLGGCFNGKAKKRRQG